MHEQALKADPDIDPRRETPSEADQPLGTVRLAPHHAVGAFCASLSARVTKFIQNEAAEMERLNYCRVFVLPDPQNTTRILGYYTLSPTLLIRDEVNNSFQRKIPKGIPVPLMLIGFMGRCDSAQKGLGAALIYDAALRVHRNDDVASWGLVLDSEGGLANPKLMDWYESVGFVRGRKTPSRMYGPLPSFLPFLPALSNM